MGGFLSRDEPTGGSFDITHHVDYDNHMKNYVLKSQCQSLGDISNHPDYQKILQKYACKDNSTCPPTYKKCDAVACPKCPAPRKCPPPKECPAPKKCPPPKECPAPKKCPPPKECPAPVPCPKCPTIPSQKKCPLPQKCPQAKPKCLNYLKYEKSSVKPFTLSEVPTINQDAKIKGNPKLKPYDTQEFFF